MGSATKGTDANGSPTSPDFPILSGPDAHAFESGILEDTSAGRSVEMSRKASLTGITDSLTLAATILKSCPLRDVIAILIILLQLPPTFLTIVHALYTLLTFVPPTMGLATLPTLHEIIHGSGGTPSLGTILVVDIIILLMWLVLWEPAQNFVLDLSQAVIAVSLGGAAAGKNGTTNGFLVCAFIVLAQHLNRHNQVRYYGHHLLWACLSRISFGRMHTFTQPEVDTNLSWTPRGWINRGFAIHIFTQGLVRWIRRSLSHRDPPSKPPATSSRDPETGLSSQPQRSNSVGAESNPDTTSSASTDGRPPGQPPASNTGKEKDSSSKKKRKQANLVRSLQPFWAALASTKVTVLKEMEQAQISPDAVEADATDVNHIGNANTKDTSLVWISEVLPTEIRFQATALHALKQRHVTDSLDLENANEGVNKARPFYIRLNGANWSSARIRPAAESNGHSGEAVNNWTGEIFGLTPLSSYYCEFIRCSNDVLISATSIITSPPPPTAEQGNFLLSEIHHHFPY
jgi:ubiquitination network signaling protein AcrB